MQYAADVAPSWRIGQTRPVKVIFMAYRGTLQADALKLVAQKLQSSLAVEGELPEDGLAAYSDDGDDIMLALARKIVNGEEEEEGESVEDAFAQARDAEALSEELLVDDAWGAMGVEPEPVVVEVHRNGTGAAAVEEANGHHDEAPETQRSLFSRAGFIAEEPVERQNRRGKKEASWWHTRQARCGCHDGTARHRLAAGVGRRRTCWARPHVSRQSYP